VGKDCGGNNCSAKCGNSNGGVRRNQGLVTICGEAWAKLVLMAKVEMYVIISCHSSGSVFYEVPIQSNGKKSGTAGIDFGLLYFPTS
jgi:hypothetical protein